ncbi:MAG TPA: hypothetical protein VK172_14825 [Lentimicrobium sp.]|nr:hypothetical protein [Bacteroidales bacterium]HLO92436.1 hypothetical protein [Lentimicrobium sp.]
MKDKIGRILRLLDEIIIKQLRAYITGFITVGSDDMIETPYGEINSNLVEKVISGAVLIADERYEQINKHEFSIEMDLEFNSNRQLLIAADELITGAASPRNFPKDWDEDIVEHMIGKSHLDRLITAGALIAAEIDRLMAKKQK